MRIYYFVLLTGLALVSALPRATAQEMNKLQKTWFLIRTLSAKGDTLSSNPFEKVRFDTENLYIFMNGLNGPEDVRAQPYSVTGNKINGKFAKYEIEAITDSSLTLSMPGIETMYFLAEGYSPCGESLVRKLGEFNGHPYYRAASYLMPHKKGDHLLSSILKALHMEKQKAMIKVKFSFIVDEKGVVQDAKMLENYSAEVDAIVLKQVQKTSGKWVAPLACGAPVATLLYYDAAFQPYEYLDAPTRSGAH